MKYSIIFTTIIALAVSGQVVFAGEITDSYATGDTLTATKMENIKTAVNDNNTKISAAGDITAVIPGSGLTGGGTSGSVTLSVGTGAITGSHIASSTVSDLDILDEPGIDFAAYVNRNITGTTSGITLCGATTAYSTLASVTITAPTTGYVMVSVNGQACTHTANEYLILALDNAPGGGVSAYDGGNNYYVNSTTFRACSIGQYESYAFQYVYTVSAGTTSYYLKACLEATTTSANVNVHPLTAVFYPTRY